MNLQQIKKILQSEKEALKTLQEKENEQKHQEEQKRDLIRFEKNLAFFQKITQAWGVEELVANLGGVDQENDAVRLRIENFSFLFFEEDTYNNYTLQVRVKGKPPINLCDREDFINYLDKQINRIEEELRQAQIKRQKAEKVEKEERLRRENQQKKADFEKQRTWENQDLLKLYQQQFNESQDILVVASNKYIDQCLSIANQKDKQAWQWAEGSILKLYQWQWVIGCDKDSEVVEYDDGWSLHHRPDKDGFITFLPEIGYSKDRTEKYKRKARKLKLSPQALPVVEEVEYASVTELPTCLAFYPSYEFPCQSNINLFVNVDHRYREINQELQTYCEYAKTYISDVSDRYYDYPLFSTKESLGVYKISPTETPLTPLNLEWTEDKLTLPSQVLVPVLPIQLTLSN